MDAQKWDIILLTITYMVTVADIIDESDPTILYVAGEY